MTIFQHGMFGPSAGSWITTKWMVGVVYIACSRWACWVSLEWSSAFSQRSSTQRSGCRSGRRWSKFGRHKISMADNPPFKVCTSNADLNNNLLTRKHAYTTQSRPLAMCDVLALCRQSSNAPQTRNCLPRAPGPTMGSSAIVLRIPLHLCWFSHLCFGLQMTTRQQTSDPVRGSEVMGWLYRQLTLRVIQYSPPGVVLRHEKNRCWIHLPQPI